MTGMCKGALMLKKNAINLFEDKLIRSVWDDEWEEKGGGSCGQNDTCGQNAPANTAAPVPKKCRVEIMGARDMTVQYAVVFSGSFRLVLPGTQFIAVRITYEGCSLI